MLSVIKRKFKGEIIPNTNGFTYELDTVPSALLKQYLSSPFNAEGIYGFEQLSSKDFCETYTFTPDMERLEYPKVQKDWNWLKDEVKNATFYEIQYKKPSFLPLFTQKSLDFTNEISRVEVGNSSIFTQVLLKKKVGNWRDNVADQYDQFLKGNDTPFESRTIRNMQTSIISAFGKTRLFTMKRDPIKDIEDKILQDNFNMEIRLVLLDSAKNSHKQFEEKVNLLLKELSYFNELCLFKVSDKKYHVQQINDRTLQSHLSTQLFSKQEVHCLLASELEVFETPQLPQPIPTTSTSQLLSQPNHDVHEAIKLFPYNQTRNNATDDSALKQLADSFKRTKITQKVIHSNSIKRGATLQKLTITIPEDVVYTNIEKNLKNIQAAIGNDSISLEIGDIPDTINFYIPCSDRDIVYLRNLFESDEFIEYVKSHPIPLVLGEDSIGNPLLKCLADLKHILVAGATGSGKSVFLNAMIITWIIYKKPEEIMLYLIDPKEVELLQYKGFPHVADVITDMDEAQDLLASLISEMDKRYSLMAKLGVKNIKQYNNKADKKLPYIICVIDETADLMDTNGEEVEDHIIRLGQKARGAGIHLVLCTQKPSADVITTRIKSNMPSAISFRLKAQSDYRTVFGKGIPFHLMGRGDGVAMLEGEMKEFLRFQAPVITLDEDEEEEIFTKLREMYKDVQVEGIEIVKQEEPLDKLKKVIASTGEVRVSELQKLMKIRINDVSELLKDLASEGWLEKEGRGYKLVASDEELEKWKGC